MCDSVTQHLMRVSEHFNLEKSQYELDFVDIDIDRDTPLFIDPYFLSTHDDPWSVAASRTVRSFFEHFVTLVRADNLDAARRLFDHFGEPNETCLGLSSGRPRGRGIGEINADDLFASLVNSRAVTTGIVEHLEDARVFVRGIDKDKISDMATNLLREHLLDYTAAQAQLWNLPIQSSVAAGWYWSARERRWMATHAGMVLVGGKRILLVPKAVVSFAEKYTPQRYHQNFVLNFLQNEHLRLNSALVQRVIRRDGSEKRFVTKKSLVETEAPFSKEFLTSFTLAHPEVFRDFRERARGSADRIANENISPERIEDVATHLIEKLRSIPSGNENATAYHRTVVGILELIFYPDLFSPQVEREIHEGRKRIDITFDNGAASGFFYLLHATHGVPCAYVMVECKNYRRDIANPEVDQIAGRFSPNRSKAGLIVCREIENMQLFLKRCADTYRDDRGVILPLVDNDLINCLDGLQRREFGRAQSLLTDRMRSIVLS
jgi:hypothetical protein